jgi:probable phosphoglycerate mutase
MSRVTRLVLVRHALHDWIGRGVAGRMPGVALNAKGREQAEALAAALPLDAVDALYSSPQQRAQETAAFIARRLKLDVRAAPEFDEIDFGEWTGRTFAELDAGAPGWSDWVDRRGSARAPGGEAFAQVRDRVVEGARRLQREHASGTVLVVTHGDPVKALIATHLSMPLDELESFDVACASLSVIELGDANGGWAKVRCLSSRCWPADD